MDSRGSPSRAFTSRGTWHSSSGRQPCRAFKRDPPRLLLGWHTLTRPSAGPSLYWRRVHIPAVLLCWYSRRHGHCDGAYWGGVSQSGRKIRSAGLAPETIVRLFSSSCSGWVYLDITSTTTFVFEGLGRLVSRSLRTLWMSEAGILHR